MTSIEFSKRVQHDPLLRNPLIEAQRCLLDDKLRSLPVELLAASVLFPLTLYVIKHIGLPWLNAVSKLSNLHLGRFHAWIDREYEGHGIEPAKLENAANQLYNELCKIETPMGRSAWEKLLNDASNPKHE